MYSDPYIVRSTMLEAQNTCTPVYLFLSHVTDIVHSYVA